jgi:hypothetical protein
MPTIHPFTRAQATLAYWASSRALKRQGPPLLHQTAFGALATMMRLHPRTRLARAAGLALFQHRDGVPLLKPASADVIPFPRPPRPMEMASCG